MIQLLGLTTKKGRANYEAIEKGVQEKRAKETQSLGDILTTFK
ncbi:hypothetical protein [Myroides injenensis]|nr:hypothetical protein [Myroides injenensis]